VLGANPMLWVMYASALSITGPLTNVEEKLQGAEAALQNLEPDAKSRNLIVNLSARGGLGQIQEAETELHVAVETYRDVLNLVGNSSQAVAGEAHLGLARIHYHR